MTMQVVQQPLFMICKDTNSKAIHNKRGDVEQDDYVVYDMQRY